MASEKNEQTISELLGTLATTTASLVRQEAHLASTEVAEQTKRGASAVGMIGAGGAIVHVGALVLIMAVVFGLSTWMPTWIAALITGGATTLVGMMILRKGISEVKQVDLVPRKTLQTLSDDVAWVKEQV